MLTNLGIKTRWTSQVATAAYNIYEAAQSIDAWTQRKSSILQKPTGIFHPS